MGGRVSTHLIVLVEVAEGGEASSLSERGGANQRVVVHRLGYDHELRVRRADLQRAPRA